MISTVTVTTITTIAAMEMGVALGIAVAITLIAFVATKELVGMIVPNIRRGRFSQRIDRFLNVGITPLLIVFTAMIAIAIAGIL